MAPADQSNCSTFAGMVHSHEFETVVGLEVHAQLLTQSKLFCGDSTNFGQGPNTQVCAISLAHPGTLPRLNKEAVALAIKLGIACHCTIEEQTYFARKNYFYPDLPKGYQVTQHTRPICKGGFVDITIAGKLSRIRLNRIHLEEDAGKSLHDEASTFSTIDYNRAGMPLVEIVTEPDIRTAEEAYAFVTHLRKLVRQLGVCDGNMEQGSLRCDVNISVRKKGDEKLGTKVEIKNLNSIRFVKKAIESESRRLIHCHRNGTPILQQTRGWDENNASTYAIRTKEDEDDYRYFPEPDLPPFHISQEWINSISESMPPPAEKLQQELEEAYGLPATVAQQLAGDGELNSWFVQIAQHTKNYKAAANWVLGVIKNYLQDNSNEDFQASAEAIAKLIHLVDMGRINFGTASQKVFPAIAADPALDMEAYIRDEKLEMETSESQMALLIQQALDKHAEKITEYRRGKKGLISLFVGEVMRLSKGSADAKRVTEKIIEKLKA